MKILYALALSLIAGTLFAGTGVSYQVVDCTPAAEVRTVAAEYQTITISEPRVKWKPEIEYVERQVQVAVPRMAPAPPMQVMQQTLSCPTCVTAPAVSTSFVPMTTSVQSAVPQCLNGQCIETYGYRTSSPTVLDSDIGTNLRYEPAVMTFEDGSQKVMRTPLRAALAARRMAKGQHTPDRNNVNFR